MPTTVDIIILSYSKSKDLQNITQNALDSLFDSEKNNDILFNVIVIESEKTLSPFQFKNTTTVYPKQKFNFHLYLNIGLQYCKSENVCFCNNDLIFHKHWATNIVHAFQQDSALKSASPLCGKLHPTLGILLSDRIIYGYEIRKILCGWCFMVKREIFDTIGPFDEHFNFWFADQDYSKTIEKHHIKHALICNSQVDHLDGISTKELDEKVKKAMTTDKFWYFQYKWEHKNILKYYWRLFRAKVKFGK